MSARGLGLVEAFAPICAVAGRCRKRHSDSDAFWGGRRRAPRRKQGMLIPLMVALISKLLAPQHTFRLLWCWSFLGRECERGHSHSDLNRYALLGVTAGKFRGWRMTYMFLN